jgi:hypothetical protein
MKRAIVGLLFPISVFAQTNVDNLSVNQQGSNVSSNSGNTTQNFNGAGSGSPMPPASAVAPSFISSGQDSCLLGIAGAVSSTVIGISIGRYQRDENCELIKLARLLDSLGLKIAAASILCQDHRVFQAMAMAGTPCPFLGAIGRQATALWLQNETLRPDYALVSSQPLRPLSLGGGIQIDSGGSLSERFRHSLRAAQPQPAAGGIEPPAK